MEKERNPQIEAEVARQMEAFTRGVEDLVSEKELEAKVRKSLETKTPLVIKLGIDPTGSDLHIGHAVPLRKLKQFQDMGHNVKLLIGTFTARIGDPTGKTEARKMLSFEDIQVNIATYLDQVKAILDPERMEVVYNHEWLEPLGLEDVLKLLSQVTVQQMIQRKDFSERIKNDKPVSLIEFMYPLLQGYDSVAMEADVELGAVDQKFNLLKGRDLQKNAGQKQQACLMMPILVGLDGVEKMSKSLNNYIGITEAPNEIFGKVMSISDDLMWNYYEMATDVPMSEVAELRAGVENGTLHPMDVKKRLGSEIVAIYHNVEEGAKARDWFENVFSKGNMDVDLPEVKIEADELGAIDLLVNELGFFKGTSDARRLIQQGGFKINDVAEKDVRAMIKIEDGMIIRAGKKKIVKIVK